MRAIEPIAQAYLDLDRRRMRRARWRKTAAVAAAISVVAAAGIVHAVDADRRPARLPTREQAVAASGRWIDQVLADAHYTGGYRIRREDLACPSIAAAHGELETVATLTGLDSVQGSMLVLFARLDWWGTGFSPAPGIAASDTSVVAVLYASYTLTLTAGADDTAVSIAVSSCYAGSGPVIPTSTSTTTAAQPSPTQPASGL